jgi:hypothetical protein
VAVGDDGDEESAEIIIDDNIHDTGGAMKVGTTAASAAHRATSLVE